ncbi:P-loop containing nucleoside triphosphate hydrolase protein [Rutstroemia sp. NJR-2017a BVV2]|nr:P-loop containing nucleoside triphosphate hydrolase protein [Rutstroemia sp. NJR-2017a BVV2]
MYTTRDNMASMKPIFCCTHPRACSTAFERVFMTRDDILSCVHEPFGDAFYFGPERLSPRYENDEAARQASGFADSTFKDIFERIEREGKEVRFGSAFLYFSPSSSGSALLATHAKQGKRLFIKDITHYLVPPEGKPAAIAPSLGGRSVKKGVGTNGETNGAKTNGVTNGETNGHTTNGNKAPYPYGTEAEPGNPTVVPAEILKQFHFTFLIRHPRNSIPSYFRCTVPPLDSVTGFYNFMPAEAGYDELRRVFDFLREQKQVGPAIAGQYDGPLKDGEVSITIIDADDLLDDPEGIIKAYCKETGIDYRPEMLVWDTEEHHQRAREAFEKWRGFHDDAINSTSLKPRSAEHKSKKKKEKSVEQEDKEWREKYGEEAQKVIRETVNANVKDYEYLKSFAVKV